ncbi:helix-turn-helix transcriptional regulator [Candidatus Woesebacteria bacterium]|nr:helix-turn-helix transcriptional regulator [Candidatus Woesebacteria bacterium]
MDTNKLSCGGVETTLRVIGGKWKPLILYLLREGSLRYSELQKNIEKITQKMLTQQLRQLELDGLISRKVYPVIPPRVEYSLTTKGRSLLPLLKSMAEWGSGHK